MAILSWGKCFITHATSVDGRPTDAWGGIDTPKEDTTKLNTTAGNETTARKEGGSVIDARNAKNTYQLEFDLFVKKGLPRPFGDEDGNIIGEHALRVSPEGENCEGIQIDRCTIRVEESYSTADGKILHYVCRILKPADGKSIKPYTDAKSVRMYIATEVRLLTDGTMRLG